MTTDLNYWKECPFCEEHMNIKMAETLIETRTIEPKHDAETITKNIHEQLAKNEHDNQNKLYTCTKCSYAERIMKENHPLETIHKKRK